MVSYTNEEMFKLRDYQEASIQEIREALAKYKKVLFQLSTGGGKTVCFSYIAANAFKKGRNILILSNRTEILSQNGGALQRMGLDVEYINQKHRAIPTQKVACGMSQTLKRRVEKQEWRDYLQTVDLCIVDEAHCCDHDFIYSYLRDNCFCLLVTATPQRQGKQEQLGRFARAMVVGITTQELIDRGYLSPARHFTIAAPRLDDVEIDNNTKEYNQKSLAKKFEDKTLYKGVIDEWFRICPDRKTIVFCVSSQQAIEFTKMLVERGVSARYVLSGNFDDDSSFSGNRSEVIQDFQNNKFQVLVNVGIAVAGTDIPDVTCIVANYATTSMTKWRQSIGRGGRIFEGKKDFIILDAGENIKRLGFFQQDIKWSLWHDTSSGGGMQMMKVCPTEKPDRNGVYGCGAMIPNTCRECPSCGRILVDKQFDYQCALEEVSMNTEDSIEQYAANRRLEGWSIPRIMISVCIANHENIKKAFMKAYSVLNPNKTAKEANSYYFVFMKQFGDKIKQRRKVE